MNEIDELTQQELDTIGSRVAKGIVYFQAAFTAAKRVKDSGGPDFTPRIQNILDLGDNLFADVEEVTGPYTAHRGLRVPMCTDPGCPLHTQSVFSQEMRATHYKCTMGFDSPKEVILDPTGEAELCDDVDCPIASTRETHTH